MKKYRLSIVIVFLCSINILFNANMLFAAAGTWIQKANFGWTGTEEKGTARVDAVGFNIGDKGYVGTGYDGSNEKDFWEYDPVADIWTQKADFGGTEGTARQAAVGFSIGNKGYLGTGYDGSSGTKDFWEYDPGENKWTKMADFGGSARYNAAGFSIGNKGYIGTGYDGSTYYKDLWEYDPSGNSWTQKANLPSIQGFWETERRAAVGFSIGNKGYIGLGVRQGIFTTITFQDFYEYNPATEAWLNIASLPEGAGARYDAVGFSIGSKGYVGTGYLSNSNHYYKDFWEYDPGTNSWTSKADVGGTGGSARQAAIGFSVGNKGYIGTGYNGSIFLKDFWEYDSGQEFLYCSFSGLGIWKWDGSNWAQITPNNPQMMVISGSNLYGTFAFTGIWKWNGATWTQVTTNNPDLVAANAAALYGSFTGNGIWKWDGSTWTQVTSNNPQSMAISGSNLYGSFAGGGIWKWDGSSWSQVTPNDPDLMAASATTLYGTFTGNGIWKWDGSNWVQVTSSNPESMVTSGDSLYGSFTGNGIWKWDGSGWSQVTINIPQLMVASDSTLYGKFAGGGIWKWDGSSWSQITTNEPVGMIVAY